MKKVISVALLVCVIALSLTACFAESDKFVGAWKCEKGTVLKATNKITFNEDFTGDFTIEGIGVNAGMTWSVDEETHTLTITPDSSVIPAFEYDYEFTDDCLVLTSSLGIVSEYYAAE